MQIPGYSKEATVTIALVDILNDIMASERLFKNIEALVQEQVRQARIDEIERIIRIGL